MPTALRPLLTIATVAALGLGATACGSHSEATPRGTASASAATHGVDVASLPPATKAELTAATITTSDVSALGMTVKAPLPYSALIWPFTSPVTSYGACAPIQAALQAGAPTYPVGATNDINVTQAGVADSMTSIHLAAYSGRSAVAFLTTLTSALQTCHAYDMDGKSGRYHQAISPLALDVGDQSVSWDQTDTFYPSRTPAKGDTGQTLSYSVVRVGSTVITVVVDPPTSTKTAPVPPPNSSLLSAQINRIRSRIH